MTDLDPCLLGCDLALAEADRLLRLLSEATLPLDPELSAVRLRISALRVEVERLRGMRTLPSTRRLPPDWIDLTGDRSPWAAPGGEPFANDEPSGS